MAQREVSSTARFGPLLTAWVRVTIGGTVGSIIALLLTLSLSARLGNSDWIAVTTGGFISGYLSRKYGWLSGLLVGTAVACSQVLVLLAIGRSAHISLHGTLDLLNWRSILSPIPVAVLAGYWGGRFPQIRLPLARNT